MSEWYPLLNIFLTVIIQRYSYTDGADPKRCIVPHVSMIHYSRPSEDQRRQE